MSTLKVNKVENQRPVPLQEELVDVDQGRNTCSMIQVNNGDKDI